LFNFHKNVIAWSQVNLPQSSVSSFSHGYFLWANTAITGI